MLLSSLAWADPYRWLERTHAPEVIEWSEARDAEARAWIDAGGETTALEAWAEHQREEWSHGRALQDFSGSTLLFRQWRRDAPLDASKPNDRVVHTSLVATREGTDHPLAADLDDTHGLCTSSLDPSGRYVAWGRVIDTAKPAEGAPYAPKPCRVYLTDLADDTTRPILEALEPRVVFGPDASRLLLSQVVGKTARITEYTRDGTFVAERLRSPRRLTVRWLPDGHVYVETGTRAAETPYQPVYANRLAWGTPEHLDWLGNALFWPPWGSYDLVGQDGDDLLLRTNVDAEAWKVVRVDPEAPWRNRWETVVPENPAAILMEAHRFGDRLLLVRRENGSDELFGRALDTPEEAPLGYSGSNRLSTHLRGDVALVSAWSVDGISNVTIAPDGTVTALDADRHPMSFESRNIPSADGTQVPVSIARPVEARPDAPVWMEVYGGFGVNVTANYSWTVQRWLEAGGIYAWVHARGGGERGEEWHEAAKRGNKSKTIDDVVAAADWFATHGAGKRIVLSGTSNGGLTAAAAVARRPDLFGAVIARSGVYDLVRGPRMGNWWPDEYGRPNGAEHDALTALSPLLATPPGPLPPILLVTGRDDPRVTPAHSFKLASAWSQLPGGPVLLRVTPWVSHPRPGDNADLSPDTRDGAWAEELAFAFRALGLPPG